MRRSIQNTLATLAILLVLFGGPALSQTARPATKAETSSNPVQNLKLNSKLMVKEMPYRVIVPTRYTTNKTKRYPVIYLLHGLTGHFNNWTDKTKLTQYAATHNFIIVTPEGNNGWYTDSATVPNDQYESYIIKELIPEIDRKFRTVADREHRAVAGLSMGGFGSIKFGLKYPDVFSLVGSFSGALFASTYKSADQLPPGNIRTSLVAIFGEGGGPMQKANDITALVREATADKIKTFPYIYLSCGTEDFLFQNNRDFVALLNDKKVPHEYREHPGVHDWVFWDDQVAEFLNVASRRIKS